MSAGSIVSPDGLPVVCAADREAWRDWLAANHDTQRGAWLAVPKKGSPTPGVSYDTAVEEALAFGWIDSRANKADETRYIQRFSPRKPKSVWSRSNKDRVERLVGEGRMAPAGMAAVDQAKRNGSWDAPAKEGFGPTSAGRHK